jgi:hypothetical protein
VDAADHAILRVRAFLRDCQSLPKDKLLQELEEMAKEVDQLGMDGAAAQLKLVTKSLGERYGRGSCQN